MSGTLWKGSIRFGETSVPVKLHAAVREASLHFHLLHRPCGQRLAQRLYCALENLEVPPSEQVKGYEIEEGRYILVDPAELEAVDSKASREIEIHEFVPVSELDPIYLDRAYYLEPDGITPGYAEMAELLEEMELAGVAAWTMRKRTYLGALRSRGGILSLSTLRHGDEAVEVSDLNLPDAPLSEKELSIARDLVARMAEPFAPERYVDRHREKLLELIERKARGEKIALLKPLVAKPTEPDRLLEALEASLKKAV